MEIDLEARRVRISVGELAGFAMAPQFPTGQRAGRWRLAAGTEWHQSIQQQSLAAAPAEVRVEVSIQAVIPLEGWQVHVSGRIDEVSTQADAQVFREIKTVRMALPADTDELRARFPSYFNQLSLYLELARQLPDWSPAQLRGELVFVDLDDGFTQNVPLDPGESTHRHQLQTAELARFLRLRTEARDSHGQLTLAPPFPEWRPGQEETFSALRNSRPRARILLFEAPTGFGKTGLAIAHALESLKAGRISRVIILTGKSSGQEPILAQLARMIPSGSGLRYLQMRNRAELSLQDAALRDPQEMRRRWREAGLRLESFFSGATVTPAELRAVGEQQGMDPHALAQALLALADIWIGDYNYLFSPGSAGVFADVIGFDPAQSLLIVDEVHNLPSRVAGAWSQRFDATQWHLLATELSRLAWPADFVRSVSNFAALLDGLHPADSLDYAPDRELRLALQEIAEHILQRPLPWEEASEIALDLLWNVPAATAALANELISILSWAPARGVWASTCLDASAETGPRLLQFAEVLAMSATLQPLDDLSRKLGLPLAGTAEACGTTAFVGADAPWREGAYRVAIDARVDTRFQRRRESLGTTARTVAEFAEGQPAPVVVFFSSYRYAEDVSRLIEWEAPHIRVALQPRGLSLPEQEPFLAESLLTAHALFLILGSSFSEGIDLLGGRIERAMVVGPALPELNAVQEAIRQAHRQSGAPDPFRSTYQIPGMTRIHQALGRLVRAPGQRAEILLHGSRFAEPAYYDLLRPEFQTNVVLRSRGDWIAWLAGSQQ